MSKIFSNREGVAIASGLLGFMLPAVAFAAPQTFAQLVYMLISYINPLAEICAVLAVLVFFWGIFKYIYSAGGEGHEKGRQLIIWGVIALFVLFSVWSLAAIIVQTFFGGRAGLGGVPPTTTTTITRVGESGGSQNNRPYLTPSGL